MAHTLFFDGNSNILNTVRAHAYAYGFEKVDIHKADLLVLDISSNYNGTTDKPYIVIVSTPSHVSDQKSDTLSLFNKAEHVIFTSSYVASTWITLVSDGVVFSYSVLQERLDHSVYKFEHRPISSGKKISAVAYAEDWYAETARKEEIDSFVERQRCIDLEHLDISDLYRHTSFIDAISKADIAIDFRSTIYDPLFSNACLLAGVPLLYVDSGCLSEYIGDFGVAIKEQISDGRRSLDIRDIDSAWPIFQQIYPLLKRKMLSSNLQKLYPTMLDQYFALIGKC